MALKDHILKLADGVSKCQENAKSLAQVIFRGLDDIADNLPEHPGGGSEVSVTQILSSGTKTATITVDNVPTDLYAPTPTTPTDVDVTQVVSTGTKIATISVDNVPTDLYAPTPTAPTDVDVTQVVSTGTKIATITVDDVPTDIYAPAGGTSQDYSTSEHVIGKWIDGVSDVYEKTIEYTPESTISSATAIGTITNADLVIIHEACGVNASQNRMWMLPMGGTTDISCNSGTVYLNINNDSWSTDWTFYVTVRYTKTS